MKFRRTAIFLIVVAAALASLEAGIAQNRDQRLVAGPFPGVKDARLGMPVTFENEIEISPCFPLMLSDIAVIAWVADAHVVEGELLLRRCVEYDPSITQTAGNRHGGVLEWERARLSPDRSSLMPTPIGAFEWNTFSNPAFCSKRVAYWGLRKDGRLTAQIFDVRSRQQVAFQPIGNVKLETDNRSVLARPRWNGSCSIASFNAEPFVPGTTMVPIPQK